ncbi:Hsp70 protein [Stackebrandtia endophytica]|uniref:Hsp70 protein n=1 Tax=Stackebrandtia endophytica TaxID=1496996 RepID=A0A543B3E2_9ACTN|nr:Hsp70 family protein [Stackebrandtia endophytica]TQL79355.1 Hsp70 protein [Stackebrandtia endophytica]
MLSAAVLGIDVGTSHTVAILRRTDGTAVPLLFDGSPLLTSAVYAEGPGELVTGQDALQSARLRPERFEPHPKRRVDDGTVLLGDNEFEVAELFAVVLRRVRGEVERVAGALPPRIVVTHPATWGPVRRLVLADACRAVGLTDATLVPEPVAAARYFASELDIAIVPGDAVVVYDFGGGTFDTSVVAATPNGFEVLAVDGSDALGGVDIDQALATHIGLQFPGDERWTALLNPTDAVSRRHRRTFMEDVRSAKERLSRQNRVDLLVPMFDVDTQVTREELEDITELLLDKAVRLTKAVMRSAEVPPDRIVGVFLVGGASRMPLAATSLHRGTGIAPTVIDQPELVVATGATVEVKPAPVAVPAAAAGYSPQPVPPVTTPTIPAQPQPVAVQQMPAPFDPPRPHGALRALHWVQSGLSGLLGMTALIILIVDPPPAQIMPIGVAFMAAVAAMTITIAVDAVRLARAPGIARSVTVVQSIVLGVTLTGVGLVTYFSDPPFPFLHIAILAPGVIAAVILGLVRLERPPQPATPQRITRELRGSLIIQLVLMIGVLLVGSAWWLMFAEATGGQIADEHIGDLINSGLLVLGLVYMLLVVAVLLGRIHVMTAIGRAVLRWSQAVWLTAGALYTVPLFGPEKHRVMPFDIVSISGNDLIARDWRTGLGDFYNRLGLWALIFSAVAAILILIQLSRLSKASVIATR